MISPEAGLSVSRQCALLEIARSSFYYRPRSESAEELHLLKRLDRIFTDHPVYGSRRLQVALSREGVPVGRRRIRRRDCHPLPAQMVRGRKEALQLFAPVWANNPPKPAHG
jgi:putative transposase